MSRYRKIVFTISLFILILIAFSLPLLYVYYMGGREIHDISLKIAADESEPELIVKGIMGWENRNIRTIYQLPHFSFAGMKLYIMPDHPYIYPRILDPRWIMFFKRGACGEDATLFVEMARVAGIRARTVYNPGEDHAWVEVLIDNSWVHVDPSWGYFDDPGVYERENEGGWGKQLSYVYAIDENGEEQDVTNRYTETGRLTVRVERDGKPVRGAKVLVKSRFLMEKGATGYSTSRLAASSETDENGICSFNLGGNNYDIAAESGAIIGYRTELENVLLEEGSETDITLSFSASTILSPDALVWLATLVLLLFAFGVTVWKRRNSIKRFLRALKCDLPTMTGILAIVVALSCAIATVVGFLGLMVVPGLLTLSWTIFGFIGLVFCLMWGILAFSRKRYARAIICMIMTLIIGIVFGLIYGGFGFVLGLPIAFLSLISVILAMTFKRRFLRKLKKF